MTLDDIEEIKNTFLDLKQSAFYLSYTEELYLDYLIKKGLPKEVILEGIRTYMYRLPIFKRRKAMLFMCDKDIETHSTRFLRSMWSNSNEYWYISRLLFQLEKVKALGINKKYNINIDIKSLNTEDITEEKAKNILYDIKRKIFSKEWETLTEEEKQSILSKYEKFKDIKELYDKMIIDDLLYRLNLHWVDLYNL